MRIERITLAMAITLTAAACGNPEEGGSPEPTPTETGTFATVIEPIFAAQCYGCHNFTRQSLVESEAQCFEDGEIVMKPVVAPGDPEGSILWMKIANISESFAYGREMPPTGQGGLIEMDPEAFATIEQWIADGAPE